MHQFFFPNPAFGWTFCLSLMSLLMVAAFTDLRHMIVPKWLTLSALVLGIVMNLARGTWMGLEGGQAWILGVHGGWTGALDGMLFTVSGFLVGFSLFFLLWILGVCGGGDVKLFAALGAWVGPLLPLWVLTGTVFVVAFITIARMLVSFPASGFRTVFRKGTAGPGAKTAQSKGQKPKKRLITFSMPVAVVTSLVLLWVFRVDLHLAPPKEALGDKVHANAH